jgi:tetratricopeptide (TPR) repeat protein
MVAEEAVAIAKSAEHASSLVYALISRGFIHLLQGDIDCAITVLETSRQICGANNIQVLMPLVEANLGYGYALAGRVSEAISLMERADDQSERIGRRAARALRLTWLGHANLLRREFSKARERAERALALANGAGERGYEAWAHKLLGDVIEEESPSHREALDHYASSMGVAIELAMRPLQAHIHLSLGRLHRREKQIDNAKTELSSALRCYQNMQMPIWLDATEQELSRLVQ